MFSGVFRCMPKPKHFFTYPTKHKWNHFVIGQLRIVHSFVAVVLDLCLCVSDINKTIQRPLCWTVYFCYQLWILLQPLAAQLPLSIKTFMRTTREIGTQFLISVRFWNIYQLPLVNFLVAISYRVSGLSVSFRVSKGGPYCLFVRSAWLSKELFMKYFDICHERTERNTTTTTIV